MGKPGGFFKKLKAKQKREASNKRRGTTGASKSDRIAKHNQMVDFFTAQRQAAELAEISSSSSDAESTDSEMEIAQSALGKLRASLGIDPSQPVADSDDDLPAELLDDDEEEEEELEDGLNEEDDEIDDDEGEVDEELVEEVIGDEEGDEDCEEEEEDEEGEDMDNDEDKYVNDDDERISEQQMSLFLSSFEPKAADATKLKGLVDTSDPWFTKYYSEKMIVEKEPQSTKVVPLPAVPNISLVTSPHASKRIEKLLKASSAKPPYIHETLWAKWTTFRRNEGRELLTAEERCYLAVLQGYGDLLDTTRTFTNDVSKMEIAALHLLNHWFKSRAVTLAHDKIKEVRGEDADDLELRDRGFGKTRILVCLPLRNIAKRYVHLLQRIIGAAPEACSKLDQFERDFSEVEEALDPTFKRRPLEFRRQFEGNIDDSFCFGLSLQADKFQLYSHVLNSDIIICSPLGLRRRIERNGDCLVALSSIEVCLIDEAHVLLMQNWQHLASVLESLNSPPRDTTEGLSEINRVFPWAIDGKSALKRQTIVISMISNATISATVRGFRNVGGRSIWQLASHDGVLKQITLPVRQHFLRFDAASPTTLDDERFTFFQEELFKSKLSPLIERDVRTILFVPSYFDFVRVRNFLHREYRESYAAISEYCSPRQQRQALGQFTDLEKPLLVITERFYFFKRYFVKMAEVLCFYSPPAFPTFYVHLIGKLSATPNSCVITTFCRFDTHELVRICGTDKTKQLLEREAAAYSFVTN